LIDTGMGFPFMDETEQDRNLTPLPREAPLVSNIKPTPDLSMEQEDPTEISDCPNLKFAGARKETRFIDFTLLNKRTRTSSAARAEGIHCNQRNTKNATCSIACARVRLFEVTIMTNSA
jgi:hypothetical protein